MSSSVYQIRKHNVSICPITGNAKLDHLVQVLSYQHYKDNLFFSVICVIDSLRLCEISYTPTKYILF